MTKILIVDDEEDIVESLSFMLQTQGYETICAYDGEEIGRASCRERV